MKLMGMDLLDFSNKRILIDGCARGIGKKTAVLLSRLGARIVMMDVNGELLTESIKDLFGSGHMKVVCDLEDLHGLGNEINKIVSEFGPFNGYVHCTGIRSYRPLNVMDYQIVQRVMNVNFVSFVEIVKALIKKGNFEPGLSIVAVSSISARIGGAGVGAYAASKAAIDGIIRSLAQELQKKKIRINSVMPGQVKTETYDETIGDNIDSVLSRQYLGLAQPEDVANAIMFLLSDMSRMITGAALPLDGGYFTS